MKSSLGEGQLPLKQKIQKTWRRDNRTSDVKGPSLSKSMANHLLDLIFQPVNRWFWPEYWPGQGGGGHSSSGGARVYCVDRQVRGFLLAEKLALSPYLGQHSRAEWVWWETWQSQVEWIKRSKSWGVVWCESRESGNWPRFSERARKRGSRMNESRQRARCVPWRRGFPQGPRRKNLAWWFLKKIFPGGPY